MGENREFNMRSGDHNWQKVIYEYCRYSMLQTDNGESLAMPQMT